MRILVLGGTAFVGRAIVEQALASGHELTLFGRGRTGPALFPGVERRRGDRDTGDYASLAGSSWDAVVDVSAYVPRHVTQATGALAGHAGRYLFISTVSVYDTANAPAAGMDEDAPRLPAELGTQEVTGETYGPLKVACEDEVTLRWAQRATVVRPGIVAGPHDPTDRFTYWVRRAGRGGRIALPGRPEQPVQVVDSRDLGRLVLALLEGDRPGTYNAVGPEQPVTLEGLIRTCAAGAEIEIVPVAAQPGFPLVLPDLSFEAMFRHSAARARVAGLTATALSTTSADVRRWDVERGEPPLSVGLTAEQEAELLGPA